MEVTTESHENRKRKWNYSGSAAVIDARTLSIAHSTIDERKGCRGLLRFIVDYQRVLNQITYSSAKTLTEHLMGGGEIASIDLSWNSVISMFVGFDERLTLPFRYERRL